MRLIKGMAYNRWMPHSTSRVDFRDTLVIVAYESNLYSTVKLMPALDLNIRA